MTTQTANPFARVSPVLALECERLFHHFSKVKDADLRVRRTLTDWWKIARADDFRYAPHFDRLVQSRLMDSLSDKRTGLAKRTVLREQEDRILQAIVELGYTPKSFPKSGPAVSGVKAGIAHHLTHCLTRSAFRKAWDRLRDSKQIAYGLDKKPEGPTERSFDS